MPFFKLQIVFLVLEISFFISPSPLIRSRILFQKFTFSVWWKRKKNKEKKNRSTPFEVSSGFEDCIYICSVIISLSKWSSGATRHFNIIDRDFNFSRTTAHNEYYAEAKISFQRHFLFFFCRLLTRIGFKKEKKTISFDNYNK